MSKYVPADQSYTGKHGVHLEIKGRRWGDPYPVLYQGAIGRVFISRKIAGGEYTAENISYIKEVIPLDLFDRETGDEVPVRVESDTILRGIRVLLVAIDYTHTRLIDAKGRSGMLAVVDLFS